MDTRDGTIYSDRLVAAMTRVGEMTLEDRRYLRPMVRPPTPAQQARGKVGRNDECPCGSGNKFKKCCMLRLQAAKQEQLERGRKR